jgi:hypothetical protein
MQTLEHLYKLQPDQDMLVWLISYNQNGRFSAKLAADAYKQLPKKKPAATTSHQPTSGTEQNQGSGKNAGEKTCSTSIPSKKTQIVLNNCLIVTLHLLVNLRQHTLPM